MLEKKLISTKNIRKLIIKMVMASKEGHIASSFSIVEILIAIFSDTKNINKNFIKTSNFVLSKGHASYAYYAILAEFGLMTDKEILSVGQLRSKYYGHLPFVDKDKRFIFGSGSLGHGLPFALGCSVARKLLNNNEWSYCLIGDGEANEGTFWETLLLSQKFYNSKLKILIDCNGSSERAIPILNVLNDLKKTFKHLSVTSCNGHNVKEIIKSMSKGKSIRVVLCKTIKGYPSKVMMNDPRWHHKVPNFKEKDILLNELNHLKQT